MQKRVLAYADLLVLEARRERHHQMRRAKASRFNAGGKLKRFRSHAEPVRHFHVVVFEAGGSRTWDQNWALFLPPARSLRIAL